MIEWFVGFHPAHRKISGWFGHVEAWGYTIDDTWLFIDPRANGTLITVEHRHDEVIDMIAARFEACQAIIKTPAIDANIPFLRFAPMTCAAAIGSIVGIRAFTPRGLRRKLLRNGAEYVHGRPKGRSSGQTGQTA